MRLSELIIIESKDALLLIPEKKVLINTINAHSFNVAQKDRAFAEALQKGDYLIPDGASIVKACRWLKAKSQPKERVTGWDLFTMEMERLERSDKRKVRNPLTGSESVRCRVMFVGSSEDVLAKIKKKVAADYPNLEVVTYSPPYKADFSREDNLAIINAINEANPDLLWIGMTAPKQEKWVSKHWNDLNVHCHVGTIGAVFDFYAETVRRAPKWMQNHSLEWLFRLVKEPKRMWRRYLIGNVLFIRNVMMIG